MAFSNLPQIPSSRHGKDGLDWSVLLVDAIDDEIGEPRVLGWIIDQVRRFPPISRGHVDFSSKSLGMTRIQSQGSSDPFLAAPRLRKHLRERNSGS